LLLLSLIACDSGSGNRAGAGATKPDASASHGQPASDSGTHAGASSTGNPHGRMDGGSSRDAAVADAHHGHDVADGGSGTPDAHSDAGTIDHPLDVCGKTVDLADYTGSGHEWIFDAVTVAVNTETNATGAMAIEPFAAALDTDKLPWITLPMDCSKAECVDQDAYADLVFAHSDTSHALLHGIGYSLGADGGDQPPGGLAALTNDDVLDIQQRVNTALGTTRLHVAATVLPQDRTDLQLKNMVARANGVIAWHTDPSWLYGYFLNDDPGKAMIEQGLDLGVAIFLVEKGTSRIGGEVTFDNPKDVGPVAMLYPAARFVIMRSAFEYGFEVGASSAPTGDAADEARWGKGSGKWPEGPYDETDTAVQTDFPLTRGVNSLIKSMRDAGIGPNQNVYAALDEVWAELITRPNEAAHVLGKLLLYVGEDNILWGTASVFYGGPQPQIEAFRKFEIPADMRAKFGYPELTAERKAKILGLNAARLFCIQPD
jgi:hypothetical protein